MKLIIIGDIHGNSIWEKIVEEELSDDSQFIFIGDYFDSLLYTQKQCLDNYLNIVNFKKKYNNTVLLIGNHDLHYLDIGQRYTGYKPDLQFVINQLLTEHIDNKLVQMAYQVDNFLFTHAGVTKTWFSNLYQVEGESISDTINVYFYNHEFNNFKFVSGGNEDGNDIYQSPIWIRMSALYDDMLENYTQIIGHTAKPEIYLSEDIICIDTLNYKSNLQSLIKEKTTELLLESSEEKVEKLRLKIDKLIQLEQSSKRQYLKIYNNQLIIKSI